MTNITFIDEQALAIFHTTAEGIAEVRADDGDHRSEDALVRLIEVTGRPAELGPSYPLTIELPDELVDSASLVLGNCLDDSAGIKPDDEGAEDYLHPGQVVIQPTAVL